MFTSRPFTSRPYSERRILIVEPPEPAETAAEFDSKKNGERAEEVLSRLRGRYSEYAMGTEKARKLSGADIARTAAAVAAGVAVHTLLSGSRREAEDASSWVSDILTPSPGLPPIRKLPEGALALPRNVAERDLVFPYGPPEIGHAYAGHPLVPSHYVPLAVVHQYIRVHKINELLRIIASLGAKKVSITVKSGRRLSGSIGAGVSRMASANATIKGSSERIDEASFRETYLPQGTPTVPDDVVWLSREPAWQQFVERRNKFQVTSWEFKLKYEETFGFDGNLKLGVAKLGVNLGGSYEEFESTEWHVMADFPVA